MSSLLGLWCFFICSAIPHHSLEKRRHQFKSKTDVLAGCYTVPLQSFCATAQIMRRQTLTAKQKQLLSFVQHTRQKAFWQAKNKKRAVFSGLFKQKWSTPRAESQAASWVFLNFYNHSGAKKKKKKGLCPWNRHTPGKRWTTTLFWAICLN